MADNIFVKLRNVQLALKAPKSQRNTFGNYNYRNCEDILEAVKPLLNEHGLTLLVSDTLENIGERYYVKATAEVYDGESDNSILATAYAREEETKKGMDAAQITGAASSYARKYALNGLFNIDDTKDADSHDNTKHVSEPPKATSTYASVAQIKLLMAKAREFSGLSERTDIKNWFVEKVGMEPTQVKKDEVDKVLHFMEEEKDI